MDWQAFFRDNYPPAADPMRRPRFSSPAAAADLSDLESALGGELPIEVRQLLTQTDGILDELLIEGDWLVNDWLIWPCSELRLQVDQHREDGVPDEYLAFSPAGADGILFLCSTGSDQGTQSPVSVWHPIEQTIETIANSLADFYVRWLRGEVKV